MEVRMDVQCSPSGARPEQFIEVFVDTPIDVAQQRDPKGL